LAWLLLLLIVYALRMCWQDREAKEAMKLLPDGVVAWAALAGNEYRISTDGVFAGRVRQRELGSWVVRLEGVRGQQKLRVMPRDAVTDELRPRNG